MGASDTFQFSPPALAATAPWHWRDALLRLQPLFDLLVLLAAARAATLAAAALHPSLIFLAAGWPAWERWSLPAALFGAVLMSRRAQTATLRQDLTRIALFIALAALAGLSYAERPEGWLPIWLALSGAGLVITRLSLRRLRRRRTVAVYGAGPQADRLIRQLRRFEADRVDIVGVFDDRGRRTPDAEFAPRGDLADFARLARGGPVDAVLLALPGAAHERIEQLLGTLQGLSETVALCPEDDSAGARELRLGSSLKARVLADAHHTACKLDDYDLKDFLEIAAGFGEQRYTYVVTPNVDHLIRLHDQTSFRRLYANAGYILLDSRFLAHLLQLTRGVRLPVCAGSDLTRRLFEDVIRADDNIVLVGASAEQAEQLRRRYGLRGLVHHNPPMGFINDAAAVETCLQFIEAHSPFRFCLLAIGSPQQEVIANALRERDKARGMTLCIGASIDFLTGRERRAPAWMQRAGLEWLHRLGQSPRRMASRYLVRGPRVFNLLSRTDVQLRLHD
ncbi:WecB/TagA/CpsF family glycosyltransferase [Solimonas soli]|uniref:WecB/TagA/CpsF family glycosyltransferase n=1 Tax=Solimonas soli TaxID=413479 RepID=UPI0004B61D9A|nr:WecB/TagA/CpsF family glycosyltransferase [Solimonas soli]